MSMSFQWHRQCLVRLSFKTHATELRRQGRTPRKPSTACLLAIAAVIIAKTLHDICAELKQQRLSKHQTWNVKIISLGLSSVGLTPMSWLSQIGELEMELHWNVMIMSTGTPVFVPWSCKPLEINFTPDFCHDNISSLIELYESYFACQTTLKQNLLKRYF